MQLDNDNQKIVGVSIPIFDMLSRQRIDQWLDNLLKTGITDVFLEVRKNGYSIFQNSKDPISLYLLDIYTAPANLAGLPSLSMPGGFIDGLPIGIQLTGNYFADEKLLNTAHQYQQVTDWHTQMPELAKQEAK